MKYNVVADNPESIVVAEYQSPFRRETHYQTVKNLPGHCDCTMSASLPVCC